MWNLIKKIYVGTNLVRPIEPRTPWANTLAYRPLKSDLNEASWKSWLNWSIGSWSVSYSNNMATVERLQINGSSVLNGRGWDFTILAYTESASSSETAFFPIITPTGYPGIKFWIYNNTTQFAYVTTWDVWNVATAQTVWSGVHLMVAVKTATSLKLYIDWVLVWEDTGSYPKVKSDSYSNHCWLGRDVVWTWTCTFGNLIVENKAWSAQEIANYYNQTKSDYGL